MAGAGGSNFIRRRTERFRPQIIRDLIRNLWLLIAREGDAERGIPLLDIHIDVRGVLDQELHDFQVLVTLGRIAAAFNRLN
jgi:hypothetical protein